MESLEQNRLPTHRVTFQAYGHCDPVAVLTSPVNGTATVQDKCENDGYLGDNERESSVSKYIRRRSQQMSTTLRSFAKVIRSRIDYNYATLKNILIFTRWYC